MSELVDTTRSPHARLRPVPLRDVRLTDGFWEPRRRINREVTLPAQYRQCRETGRIENFRRAAGKSEGPFRGRCYHDSDVYKWVEAAAYAIASDPDPTLEAMLQEVVREIADAQQPDGYLNTYCMFEREEERWTNLRDLHELYCAGHLIQAAVGHARCAGGEELLGTARRLADHIVRVFGPEGRPGACGHQEIEMALVELYRRTGSREYLEQARRFLEMRGRRPPVIGGSPYHQDHAPFRELDAVVGHAVRMVYYCCGAADLVLETGDPEYRAALERLWSSMVHRRMYVTGGIGSRHEGEAFGADFELPSERAYAESCAAIGSLMWQWRMLQLTGEARFSDLMENLLYNAILPGLSLDGQLYFYQNPLADHPTAAAGTHELDRPTGARPRDAHRRQPWFDCACCPPNLARLLAQLPAYFYSASADGVWVHLYAASSAALSLPDGSIVHLTQETRYPWEGRIRIEVRPEQASEVTLFVRIPAWCRSASALVNGRRRDPTAPGTYLAIRRSWQRGDVIDLDFPMPVERIYCHPYVAANEGRVALRRGPVLYCIEQCDLGGADPRDVVLPRGAAIASRWHPELLGGVMALQVPALRRLSPAPSGSGPGEGTAPPALYAPTPAPRPVLAPVELTAVPYYSWANRAPGGMQVWVAEGE